MMVSPPGDFFYFVYPTPAIGEVDDSEISINIDKKQTNKKKMRKSCSL